MRLYEFAGGDDVVDTLASIFNQILSQSDRSDATSELSYEAISQLLTRSGNPVMMDYKVFDKIFHQPSTPERPNPIPNLVQDYNGRRVKLATSKQPDKGPPGPNMAKTDQGVTQATQQAASSGAAATLKNS
jgi:hypothetical protein